jgi:mono/diheme cytochrome c family protein
MLAVMALTTSLLAASCSKPSVTKSDAGPVAATDTESLEVLRESARELLDANCGECHTRGLPTALPRALTVYDLTQLDWSRRMSDDQLREAERRLREPLAPTRGEEEVRPIRASDAELDRFRRYVEHETGRRAGGR